MPKAVRKALSLRLAANQNQLFISNLQSVHCVARGFAYLD
jgi:putative hemolysin